MKPTLLYITQMIEIRPEIKNELVRITRVLLRFFLDKDMHIKSLYFNK
jgi:hypothetical protein